MSPHQKAQWQKSVGEKFRNTGRTRFKKGMTPWNKGMRGVLSGEASPNFGKRHSSATKAKISASRKGKLLGADHWEWKGNTPGYRALHDWVTNRLGKASWCTQCFSMKRVQWANISHQYKRDLDDWIQLCQKCHRQYDAFSWGVAARIFERNKTSYGARRVGR